MATSTISQPGYLRQHNFLTGVNLNDYYKEPGLYFERNNNTNAPDSWCHLMVIKSPNHGNTRQIIFTNSSIFNRRYDHNSQQWNSWAQINKQVHTERGTINNITIPKAASASSGGTISKTVTFGSSFSSAPTVILTPCTNSGVPSRRMAIKSLSVTTTNFTVTIENWFTTDTTALTGNRKVEWIAFGA